MKVEYLKFYSKNMECDVELKTYGEAGVNLLVFPCKEGRFFDFENFGMIDVLKWHIGNNKIKITTVDSLDNKTWSNNEISPFYRAKKYLNFNKYIMEEVYTFIYQNNPNEIFTSGASMGAYHAANFFFKYPEKFSGTIALSGVYSSKHFIGDYMDDNVYFNSPISYLSNLKDPSIIKKINAGRSVLCCGQGAFEESMLADIQDLEVIFEKNGINTWIDIWGQDVNHDWPWWHKQWQYFISNLILTRDG